MLTSHASACLAHTLIDWMCMCNKEEPPPVQYEVTGFFNTGLGNAVNKRRRKKQNGGVKMINKEVLACM